MFHTKEHFIVQTEGRIAHLTHRLFNLSQYVESLGLDQTQKWRSAVHLVSGRIEEAKFNLRYLNHHQNHDLQRIIPAYTTGLIRDINSMINELSHEYRYRHR